jgi:hypothetical protein
MFAGSNPAEAGGFLRAKKSSAAFLRRGSKTYMKKIPNGVNRDAM